MNQNASCFLLDRNLSDGRADRVAIFHGGGQHSFSELAEGVNRAGNHLLRLGVQPEQRVVLQLHDGPELVFFFIAALKIGAVAVPVNTFCNAEVLVFYLNDTRAPVLVTHDFYATKSPPLADQSVPFLEHVLYVEDEGWKKESTALAPFPVCGDDSAFWLYTSGSTGMQKAAVHSHAGVLACARNYGRDVLNIGENDRCYSASKLFFAYGLGNSVIFPFSVGASCILNPGRSDPETIAAFVKRYQPTLFFSVPTLYSQLLSLPQVNHELFAGVRMCISAGEYLPEPVFDAWRKQTGQPIYDGIGSTEALHIFCSNRPDANKPGTSGVPVAGYRLKIVDEQGAPVGKDEVGRLLVCGKTLAKGYWNRYDMSQLAFQGEWLATGDIYQQTDDGYFRYIGRQDDVFKSSGLWVSPGEVEQVLLSHPYVKEAAVVAIKDSVQITFAKAFVTLNECGAALSQDLVKQGIYSHLRERLSKYKIPAAIKVLSALPRTPTGKIARAELRCIPVDEEHAPVPRIREGLQESVR